MIQRLSLVRVRVRVWDAPTRIVHWLLVALVATSWWTAENGQLQIHRYSGYTLLGLLVFRAYWAFAGSSTSRLGKFLRGPRALLAYVKAVATRRDPQTAMGPNPLGAWSAFALLALLIAQVSLGLFAVDVDGIESGPLSHLVSFDVGRTCAQWHEDVFNVLIALIALHVAAVLFYVFYRRENLIRPMISGVRTERSEVTPPVEIASWRRAIGGIALAAAATWAVIAGFWL
ncbi:MAG: cytochrome b/b6 domain-containing protein [Steroidobacter sp.]